MMFSQLKRDSVEKVQTERADREQRIRNRIESLSYLEQKFMNDLLQRDDESDLSSLHRLAFYMLAGMPLKEFAPSLLAWVFADSINSSIHVPRKEFQDLVRFNRVDWAATRDALSRTLSTVVGEQRSKVGDWTVVGIYRATGDRELGKVAETMAEDLTRDQERFGSWSLTESYSAVDPCDPSTHRPDNVGSTAERFKALDVSSLRTKMGQTPDDNFFEGSIQAIARFEPDVGIEKIQEWARNIVDRRGFSRRQGLIQLLPHSVVLSDSIISSLLDSGYEIARQDRVDEGEASNTEARDEWLITQYSMFISLPHLSGDQQLEALAHMDGSRLLLNMLSSLRPASPSTVERWLQKSHDQRDQDLQIRILAAIHYADSPLTTIAEKIVSDLQASENGTVRSEAFAIAGDRKSELILSAIVKSDWSANSLEPEKNYFEIWHGSRAMIAAIQAGFISPEKGLERLALPQYGHAAAALGGVMAERIAVLIDSELSMVMHVSEDPETLEIEVPAVENGGKIPPMVSLEEKAEPEDVQAALTRLSRAEQDYSERQERAHRAYSRLSQKLTLADARLALTDLGFAGVSAMVEARPDLAMSWAEQLMRTSGFQQRSMREFGIQVASALIDREREVAVNLFHKFTSSEPLIRYTIGSAKIAMEATALWSNAHISEIRSLCCRRLERAENDKEISTEVLAALWADQQDLVMEIAEMLLSRGDASDVCRALMIVGYGLPSERAEEILRTWQGSTGFIGSAHTTALSAYEKDKWSRHWYSVLASTSNHREFWRAATLLSKIVDGRFAVWSKPIVPHWSLFSSYFPTIESRIENRIQRTQNQRQEKLFGQKLPDSIFLQT
jgi:hypothetical protein